jgi:cyanophycinase
VTGARIARLAALVALGVLVAGAGSSRDARAAAEPPCVVSVYGKGRIPPRRIDDHGPSLVLSGAGLLGMPYPAVLRWMRARMSPPHGRLGSLLVLQASGENDYVDAFDRTNTFAVIHEVLIPACASRAAVDRVRQYARSAEAVLFAGGDQSHYVAWKGSALMHSVRNVFERGGTVGGGSAGLAIQGAVVYDSVAADRVLPDDDNLDTPRAVRDPYGPAVSLTTNLFAWPPLAATITDSHFAKRDRFGRLAAFMARALNDRLVRGDRVYGLGIDQGTVLLVDRRGVATMMRMTGEPYRTRGAYLLIGGAAERIAPGKPLRYRVDVLHISRPGQRLDLVHHTGDGTRYAVRVDGSGRPLYSRDPYGGD